MINKLRDKWKRLDTRIQDFIVVSPFLLLIFMNSTNSAKPISSTSSQINVLLLLPIVFIEGVVYWDMFELFTKKLFTKESESVISESDKKDFESKLKTAIDYFQKMNDSYRFVALLNPHNFEVLIENERVSEKDTYINKEYALKKIKKILKDKKNSSNNNYSEYREKDSFISIILIKKYSLVIAFYTTVPWMNLNADVETEERFFKIRLTNAKREVYDVILNKYS